MNAIRTGNYVSLFQQKTLKKIDNNTKIILNKIHYPFGKLKVKLEMITLQTIDEIDQQSVYTGIKSTGPSGIGYNSHLYLRKNEEIKDEWDYTEFLTIDTKG
jgi:hypothetical protein